MADKVKVWFDKEGDFLEVTFTERAGYMRETAHDAVMERVDERVHLNKRRDEARNQWQLEPFATSG